MHQVAYACRTVLFGCSASCYRSCYATFIVWLYIRQPQSVAEVTGGLAATVGAYRINQRAFDDGLALFRRDSSKRRARRSSAPIRPGATRGRSSTSPIPTIDQVGADCIRMTSISRQGLQRVDKAIALAPDGRLVVDDPELDIHSADELRAELVAGTSGPTHPTSTRCASSGSENESRPPKPVYLPLLLLTVVLLGGIRVADRIVFAPPPLFALVLGIMLFGVLVRGQVLAPDRLMNMLAFAG